MPPIFFYALYVLTLGTISIHVRYRNGRELNLTGWTGAGKTRAPCVEPVRGRATNDRS